MLLIIIFNLFISFLILGFFGRFLGFQGTKYFACFNIFFNLFSIFYLFFQILNTTNIYTINLGNWISSGVFNVEWSFIVDDLTIIMLIVVNFISALVHLYSTEYMSKDPHLVRFMSYLTLFTFFMVILITADNFLQLFFGWEGIGLCSYLLTNFWFTRIQANKSALKAIIVNRISDFGLTFGILLVFFFFLNIDFVTSTVLQIFFLKKTVTFFGINFYILNIITFFLFFGAVGKSAQILLHTWLPDAMEGPTPVSALLHAATMVTAGVFLIIKCSTLFEFSYTTLSIICFWGAITSIFAATSGLFLSDIKKVIAYSTCSQLGYMILVCGFSHYSLSLFHLMNHAAFKAALFLCAGAIIHSLNNEQDMRRMGGLIKFLPISYIVMFIASLAIIGFPFLTGFYSKDFIFEVVFNSFGTSNIFIYWIISITAFFTTVYSLRLLFNIFFNEANSFRYYIVNIHESSFAISFSLIILALCSIFSGFLFKELFLGFGNLFLISNINPFVTNLNFFDAEFVNILVKLVPLFMGIFGLIFFLLLIYFFKQFLFFYTKIGNFILYFLVNKWYFDYIYNHYINFKIFFLAKSIIYKFLDKGILEIFGPFGFFKITKNFNNLMIKTQTGSISLYLFFYGFFVFCFIYIFTVDFFFASSIVFFFSFPDLKLWFYKQRYLFWCVKEEVFDDYFDTMEYYLDAMEEKEGEKYDNIITNIAWDEEDLKKDRLEKIFYHIHWEYYFLNISYNTLWLFSLGRFFQVYWPILSILTLIVVFFFSSILFAVCFTYLLYYFMPIYYLCGFYIMHDLSNICFPLINHDDSWFIFGVLALVFFKFVVGNTVVFWNFCYSKMSDYMEEKYDIYPLAKQDTILTAINIFFGIIVIFLIIFWVVIFWDWFFHSGDICDDQSRWKEVMRTKRKWRYSYGPFIGYDFFKVQYYFSGLLPKISEVAAYWNKPHWKFTIKTYYLHKSFWQNYWVLDFYRTPTSLFYSYTDNLDKILSWSTWRYWTPLQFIYMDLGSYTLWPDSLIFFSFITVFTYIRIYDNESWATKQRLVPITQYPFLLKRPFFKFFIIIHIVIYFCPLCMFYFNIGLLLFCFYVYHSDYRGFWHWYYFSFKPFVWTKTFKLSVKYIFFRKLLIRYSKIYSIIVKLEEKFYKFFSVSLWKSGILNFFKKIYLKFIKTLNYYLVFFLDFLLKVLDFLQWFGSRIKFYLFFVFFFFQFKIFKKWW